MGIPDRFAGRADGSEWMAILEPQGHYGQHVERFNRQFPPNPDELCPRNPYCVLTAGHPDDCLAFMLLHNLPADPTLPPERRAPGTTA